MWTLGTPPLELVIRAAVIYVVFFGALRLFGKREIGQFTLFDLSLCCSPQTPSSRQSPGRTRRSRAG